VIQIITRANVNLKKAQHLQWIGSLATKWKFLPWTHEISPWKGIPPRLGITAVGTSLQLQPKNVLSYCNMQCCSALSIWCCIFLILGENSAASLRVATNQGRRQQGAIGSRSLHLKYVPPILCLVPSCCIHPIWFLKNVPPLAGRSWRRACNQRIPYSRWSPCNRAQGHVHSVTRKNIILWYTSTLPTASMVKYKRDSTGKFWYLCWFANFGCKHAWAQKTWKPWKSNWWRSWRSKAWVGNLFG